MPTESPPAAPGRPVGPDGRGRSVRVYIPASVLEALEAEAELRGMGRSSAIVDAVKRWLGRGD